MMGTFLAKRAPLPYARPKFRPEGRNLAWKRLGVERGSWTIKRRFWKPFSITLRMR